MYRCNRFMLVAGCKNFESMICEIIESQVNFILHTKTYGRQRFSFLATTVCNGDLIIFFTTSVYECIFINILLKIKG